MACTLENDAAKDDELNWELYNAILNEEVENVIKLCERFADHATRRLTIHEDTVLHVATYSKQTDLVLGLLEALPHHHIHKMTTSKNVSWNTIHHEVATLDGGLVEVAAKMLEKAEGLLSMHNELGKEYSFRLPVMVRLIFSTFWRIRISEYDEAARKSLIQRNDKTTISHWHPCSPIR